MTDEELIARLRDEHVAASRTEAADRIEALIAERDEYHSEAMTYIEKWGAARKAQDEAEAKLAKAMEALERIEGQAFRKARATARATLAEIKGESHE